MNRIPAIQFTFELWRAGSLNELGVRHREGSIRANRIFIRRMATGFTEGHRLSIRPKPDCIAVMFYDQNLNDFWTHLSIKEFIICFPELQKQLQNIKKLSI